MADNSSNVETYTLILAADPSSTQGAIAQINAVNASLANVGATGMSVADQLAALGASGQQVFLAAGDDITASLITPMDGFDASIQNAIHDIGDLGRDIQAIPDPPMGAFEGEDPNGGGGGGSGIGGARGALRASAGLLGADAGGGVLRAVSQVAVLTSTFGLAGTAAAAFEIGLRAVSAGQQAATKTAQDYAAALGGIGTQTKTDIQKNIDDLNAQKAAFTEGRGILEGYQVKLDALNKEYGKSLIGFNGINPALNDLNEEIYKATGGAYGLKDGIGNVVVNSGMLNAALDENQKSIDKVNAGLASNTTALDSQAVAANTAAAALKQFSDDQVKAAQHSIDISHMTQAQRDEKAAQDMADYDLLQKRIDAGGLTLDAETALRAEQQNLLSDYRELTGVTSSYADQLAREAAAKQNLTDSATSSLDALANEVATHDKIAALNQQLADDQADYAKKYAELEDDYQIKRGEIVQDGADKVAQINQDNSDRLVKIAQDNADRVAQIERDFTRSYQDAVGNRDAYAAQKAEQKRADDLTDQDKHNQEAQAQQTQAYQKQLEAQDKAQAKQLRSLEDGYDKQLLSLEDALQKQRDTINRQLQQEYVDLANFLSGEAALRTQYYANMIAQAEQLQSAVPGIDPNATGGAHWIGSVVGGGSLPPYQETPGDPSLLPPVSGTAAMRGTVTLHITPQDSGAAVNTLLEAIDGYLVSRGV